MIPYPLFFNGFSPLFEVVGEEGGDSKDTVKLYDKFDYLWNIQEFLG